MFRCFVGFSGNSGQNVETRVNNWISKNAEWDEDNISHSLTQQSTESGESYYSLDVRFLKEKPKNTLLQEISDKLENKVDWYRIGYQNCTHDENPPKPCEWDEVSDWSANNKTIPQEIPEMKKNE
jgi:hypothetical protein